MNWLLKATKILLIVALAAAVGFCLFVAGRYLIRHWPTVLMTLYVIGGIAMGVISLVLRSRIRHTGDIEERVMFASAQAAVSKMSMLSRIRSRIASVLLSICGLLAWPANVVIGISRAAKAKGTINVRSAATTRFLAADELVIEPIFMTLLLAACIGSTVFSSGPPRFTHVVCYITIAYASCLCLGVTINSTSLSERLRRASGSPYRKAVLLAALMALILVMAYATVNVHGVPQTSDFLSAIRGLYSQLNSAKDFLNGETVSGFTLAQGVSGALLTSAVVQGLLSLREFKRTDEDYTAIASVKLMLGKVNDAMVSLDKVTNPSVSSMTVRALALIGVDRTADAFAIWRRRGQLLSTAPAPTEEESARELVYGALGYPFQPHSILAMVEYWLRNKPPESAVILNVEGMIQKQLPPKDVLAKFEAQQLSQSYPVAYARLRLVCGDLKEADELASTAPPGIGAVEFSRLSTVLLSRVLGETSSEQDRETLEAWCNQHLSALSEQAAQLTKIEDLMLALGIMALIEHIASSIHSVRIEAIRYLITSLTARVEKAGPDTAMTQAIMKYCMPPGIATRNI